MPAVREADRVEQLPRAPVRAGVALEPEAERDRARDREPRVQRLCVALIDVADRLRAVPRERTRAEPPEVAPEHPRRPGRRPVDACEQPQHARLAGTARPEHREQLAVRHRQRQPLQRGGVSFRRRVHPEDVAKLDRVHASASFGRPASPSRNAARVVDTTIAAPTSPSVTSPASTRPGSVEGSSGGTGDVPDADTATTSVTIPARIAPATTPPTSPASADDELPDANDPAKRAR